MESMKPFQNRRTLSVRIWGFSHIFESRVSIWSTKVCDENVTYETSLMEEVLTA